METRITTVAGTGLRIALIVTAGLMVLSGIALADEAGSRVSVSTEATRSQRDQDVAGRITRNEFGPLATAGERGKTAGGSASSKLSPAAASAPNSDFWFYDADVVLFNDHDGDGYFYGIDLWFDADTIYTSADVYAVVYLSLDGGPWNEYAATDNFNIAGTAADDDYNIVTELLSGYPGGSYDLLIELFDAASDEYIAYIGPDDTPALAFLQLEDANRDQPVEVPEVIVVHEHGGGSMTWLLLALGGIVFWRRGIPRH